MFIFCRIIGQRLVWGGRWINVQVNMQVSRRLFVNLFVFVAN